MRISPTCKSMTDRGRCRPHQIAAYVTAAGASVPRACQAKASSSRSSWPISARLRSNKRTPRDCSPLRCGRGPLFLKHHVNRCLDAFFAVGAGHAHRADQLAVDHNRQSTRLRKIVHERRSQILAGAHDLVHFRGRPAPAECRFRLQESGIDGIGAGSLHGMGFDLVPRPIQYRHRERQVIALGPSRAGVHHCTCASDMVHIPYRGAGPAMTDLLSGQVQVYIDSLPSSIEYIRSGKLRALGVTSASRSDALPDIPAIGELVSGYEAGSVYGVGAPRGTPAAIVSTLNKEINAALTDAKLKTRLAELGATAIPGSPAEFGKLIAEETERWGKVVKFSGAKPE